jgi:hypothetical protein
VKAERIFVTPARAQAMRVRPARIIRTHSQAATQPMPFDAAEASTAWIAEMRSVRP